MEDLVKLTEDLVLAIVSNKEAVKVNASEVDEQTIQIDVLVDEKDMPILIGRKGKVVNSIRTLLHASSYLFPFSSWNFFITPAFDNKSFAVSVTCAPFLNHFKATSSFTLISAGLVNGL